MDTASRITFAKHFVRCDVREEREILTGRITLHIEPVWQHVDRPMVGGWGIGNDPKLAARLKAAVEDGAAFTAVDVRTDVNGQTFVHAAHAVIGRRMNANLLELGF